LAIYLRTLVAYDYVSFDRSGSKQDSSSKAPTTNVDNNYNVEEEKAKLFLVNDKTPFSIVAIGGRETPNLISEWRPFEDSAGWQDSTPIKSGLWGHSAVISDRAIITVGGFQENPSAAGEWFWRETTDSMNWSTNQMVRTRPGVPLRCLDFRQQDSRHRRPDNTTRPQQHCQQRGSL